MTWRRPRLAQPGRANDVTGIPAVAGSNPALGSAVSRSTAGHVKAVDEHGNR